MDQDFDDASPEQGEGDYSASDEGSAESSGEPVAETRPAIDYEPTGVDSVDRVLADVATVADRPVGEHVEVFERAHEQLRRALDAQPDAAPDGGQGA
ncbi:hypothetical protein J2X46_004854 [Nocardioides sp. BE266]|uniref:hypothetical protein n=1 Tax=Nocardioides sp. BE266 TaxID=2817725 RepID=UPI00286101C2|nr:hypothetical protein [Nocardioides sp. BE266]MDR7255835.1 hypothetical protein [Nocardioides sp. BE266]